MDPLSVLGVAAAVVQFVDFTSNVISEALEIKNSASETTVEKLEIEIVATSVQELTQNLDEKLRCIDGQRKLSQNERAVQSLGGSCRVVAQELQSAISDLKNPPLEIRIRGKGKARAWDNFRQALKTVWRQGDIESLERRLDRLRQQLIVSLLLTIQDCINPKPSLKTSAPGADDNIAQKLVKHIAESKQWQADLVEAIYRNEWRAENEEHIVRSASLLSTLAGTDRADFLKKKLLHQLSFHCMADRHEGIADAYRQTFEWIFRDTPSGGGRWDSFTDWLSHDAAIYWITGKAGSGKSTLMKFIYHNTRTAQLLQRWAQNLRLVISAFFFWNSGIKMQMSQSGLLRSLLHDALLQCPQLVPIVFPAKWDTYMTFGGDLHPWTVEELLKAFKILISHHGTTAKFCFIIDGLDEFDGEHEELIEWLQSVVMSSKVKVCVSSRPWLVFEDAFRCSPSLRLQDLTYQDIKYYITAEFFKNATVFELNQREPDYIAQLINEVAHKASGVFLWVRLVVRSLLKGITNGDRVSDIRRRLDNLPADLEELFRKMLDSIDPFYLEHASQLFQLVRAAVCPLSVLTLSFADEEDPEAVFKLPVQPLNEIETRARLETIRRRINSRCKGLLEAVPVSQLGYLSDETLVIAHGLETLPNIDDDNIDMVDSEASKDALQYDVYDLAKFKVEYIHRTVKDYLAKPEVWSRITNVTASTPFHAHQALCRSFIMLMKTLKPHSLTREEFWYLVWMVLEHAAQVEASTGESSVALLDELDSAAVQLTTQKWPKSITFLQAYGMSAYCSKSHWTMTRPSKISVTPECGFLLLAIQCGLCSYVQSKLDEKYKAGLVAGTETLLHWAISDDKEIPDVMSDTFIARAIPNRRVVAMLLDLGANPNSSWGSVTAWKQLLGEADKALKLTNPRFPIHDQWIGVVELFIEHGADPNVDFDRLTSYKLLRFDSDRHRRVIQMLKQRRKKVRQRR